MILYRIARLPLASIRELWKESGKEGKGKVVHLQEGSGKRWKLFLRPGLGYKQLVREQNETKNEKIQAKEWKGRKQYASKQEMKWRW